MYRPVLFNAFLAYFVYFRRDRFHLHTLMSIFIKLESPSANLREIDTDITSLEAASDANMAAMIYFEVTAIH